MKKCLIVVDYQNDFVSERWDFQGAKKLDGKISIKLKNIIKTVMM